MGGGGSCGACGSRTHFPDTHLCWGVSELKEEVVYYDVCEDAEELQSLAHAGLHQSESAALRQLRRRLQTLETKRGSICARRAYLRNKRVCMWAGRGGGWGRRGWGKDDEVIGKSCKAPIIVSSPRPPCVISERLLTGYCFIGSLAG